MNKNLTFDRSYCTPSCQCAQYAYFSLSEQVKDKCLNDNQIVQIIFQLSEKLGIQPNRLDLSLDPSLSDEVRSVLQMLTQEYPAVKGFATDREAFDTIKSRYIQSAGEMSEFVDSLASDFLKSKNEDEIVDVSSTDEIYNSYGSVNV